MLHGCPQRAISKTKQEFWRHIYDHTCRPSRKHILNNSKHVAKVQLSKFGALERVFPDQGGGDWNKILLHKEMRKIYPIIVVFVMLFCHFFFLFCFVCTLSPLCMLFFYVDPIIVVVLFRFLFFMWLFCSCQCPLRVSVLRVVPGTCRPPPSPPYGL